MRHNSPHAWRAIIEIALKQYGLVLIFERPIRNCREAFLRPALQLRRGCRTESYNKRRRFSVITTDKRLRESYL
jgi:hypothetical protein